MSAGALAIISIVWLEASPMPTEYMVVPLALIAAAVSIAARSQPRSQPGTNPGVCTPSVSSQIMSGMLELTRRGLFLATVTPDKRPAEMKVLPSALMLRMDPVSAARLSLRSILIWD